ncbi:MAG: hypothetical protein B7Y75_03865 [Azorhizobium sp. 35-67-5]|nr:MAG: hypothetical protein B7Y75_03865 [Azorhizobium sp. 35-67-5]
MAALALPLLARRLLAEGAFNAALIPALNRAGDPGREAEPGPRQVAGGTLLLLCAVLLALAGLGAAFMPALITALAPGFEAGGARADLAIQCGRIAVLYLPLAGAAAVYGGIANANHRVALPALAPILANLVVLAAIILLVCEGWIGTAQAARAMAIATVLAGVAQLALMMLAARGSATWPRVTAPDWAAARAVLRASAPALVFAGLSQLRLLIVAAVVSADPGSVSALNYAQRLVDLPLGLVGASAGAVLVPLLAAGGRGAGREAAGALLAALALALPAAAGLALLAEPIVSVLYQRGGFTAADTQATAWLLTALAFALPAQGAERVLAATALSHGLTRPVEKIALMSLANCAALALGFGIGLGPVAAACAIAVSATVSAATMTMQLAGHRLLTFDAATGHQLRSLLGGSTLMALAVGGLAWFWPGPDAPTLLAAARLGALVAVGLVVYGGFMLGQRRLRRV